MKMMIINNTVIRVISDSKFKIISCKRKLSEIYEIININELNDNMK